MKYRTYGSTGEKVSALGFGCMRLPEVEINGNWYIDEDKALPMLFKAYVNGINYFDSAPYYCHSNSEQAMGKALKDVRDKVKFTTKLPVDEVKRPSDLRRFLENSLKKMDTPYIDFYHFWGMNLTKLGIAKTNDLFNEARKAKEEGLIKHLSFSFHDAPENMIDIINAGEGLFDSVLCQYNLLDRANEKSIAYARKKGLGVAAMGPVAGGRLAAPTELYRKLTGKESIATYELALKFVLGNADISLALSGMENMDMLEKNLAIANLDTYMTKSEWDNVGKAMGEIKKFSELYCTGCNYCQPCPKNIIIPKIFNMYTYHNVYGLTDVAKKEFGEYKNSPDKGALPEACVDCGMCESKCPQHLKIRSELKRVVNVLEGIE
ncbi:aldo/keto reductase [Clostridium lacusfryxellense]|uniref:aldo/keto reductase n=1 Tax=Clostridium lacusfryxellense TaxID=205328 RepID=UPI001C0B33E5|nr:aldo/keto reductase [Clostridium lacusfryxellense]MBU3112260.1 aldo/keto reductase [Clostridium lacusfryxellense]